MELPVCWWELSKLGVRKSAACFNCSWSSFTQLHSVQLACRNNHASSFKVLSYYSDSSHRDTGKPLTSQAVFGWLHLWEFISIYLQTTNKGWSVLSSTPSHIMMLCIHQICICIFFFLRYRHKCYIVCTLGCNYIIVEAVKANLMRLHLTLSFSDMKQ